jgi:hypothetical protein
MLQFLDVNAPTALQLYIAELHLLLDLLALLYNILRLLILDLRFVPIGRASNSLELL